MSRLQRNSLRAVVIFTISLSLIDSPMSSLRLGRAASRPPQSPATSYNATESNVVAATMFFRRIIAWFQGGPNLGAMRLNAPSPPNAYQQTGSLPDPGYDDPRPVNTANFTSYLTQMSLRHNATGVAGSIPMQLADPTVGASAVGGFSYNLDSRNFNFTFPGLSSSGRAGTGVSLFLGSDSKLWTTDPNTGAMVFNADKGFPAPGWRLGFGAILVKTQAAPTYSNSVTGKASIIYMAPDGSRHDLACNPATGAYESYDSTYLRFDLATRILRMPNGAQIHFTADSFANGDARFLPTLIKDPNGNFINVYYRTLTNNAVVPDYVIDTAGRRIDFNYQNNRLTSISQNRNGNTFYFVRIDYTAVTIQTKFNLAVTDPVNINGSQVYFPSRITYPTGVNFRIIYTSYGQILSVVKWVPTISGQGGERPIASTSLPQAHCVDPNAPYGSPNYCDPQGQSPYFPSRSEWAENWQANQSQTYSYFYDNPLGQHEIVDPTARRFRVNRNGMVQSVAVVSPDGSEQFKKDEMTYISDSGVPYLSNLRASQAKTTDDMNHVRITNFSYLQRDGMWLVENKDERDGVGALLRRTAFTYTSYPSQYILGLPQQVSVHDGALTLVSRVTNNYDQTGTFVDSNNQTAPYFIDASSEGVIQHDDANFGAGLTTRGNVTSVTQSKVEGGAVTGSRVINRVSFDTNGNVRAVTDGAGNRSQFQFGDYCVNKPGGVGQTHVVPYTAADPTAYRKGSQWDYFTGLTVKSFNLTPGSSTETQIVTTSYDFADRPLQTTRPDGGWVKTAFWDNWLATVSSQLVETGKTRYKFKEYDGAGRVRRKASDHPDGVEGKFSGQVFVFNKLGQTEDSSNVIAINGSWVPSYEDASTGFLFTHLTRDELSRLKVVTFPDNNTRQYEYTGCGCAGSSETRITDEMGHYTTTKTDALGRLVEAIEPPTVGEGYYSKANYFYDAMDRLIRTESYGVYNPSTGLTETQTRYFSYDGYGRLSQENTPEGGVITHSYTANDLPLTKTDARNITTTFIYNTRNLVTSIGYSDSTPGVTFTYDDFGARQTMTDGEGGMGYIYNGFRQLESETRLFTALSGKQHTLNYSYNLADQPKSVNYAVSESSGSLIPPAPGETSRDATTRVASVTRPDIPTAEMAVGMGGKRGVEVFDGARAVVSASALKPGQRARWRPSSAEAMSPRIIKTALRRVVPPSAAQNPSISGRVATSQGAGIQGVNITVTGSPFGPNSAVTDSNGDYTVPQLWPDYNYTVTPSKAGYTFNPTNRIYNQLNESVTDADFTGAPVTYSISGRVTNSQGTGISQVTVTLSGTQSGTTTTNGNGDFSFTNLTAGGNYTVTPSKAGYSFTPSNRSYTNLSANVTNANFTIAPLPPPPFTAFNKTVNYAYNSVGSLGGVGTNMIGSDPNATTNVLNELEFRANGALRELNYGNGRRLTMGYNANRNQPISMKVDRVSNPSDKIIDYVYDYYDQQGKNNNRIRKITDNVDGVFTTDYSYDDYNRLTGAVASSYTRSYQHDRWGNITNFSGLTHNYATNSTGAPATNRISSDSQGTSFSYDAAGNMTQAGSTTYGYDGASRLKSVDGTASTYGYDGNGGRARATEWDGAVFYVRSSVLGQVAMEVNSSGVRRAYVYAGSKVVAQQSSDGQFYWLHTNHLGSARAMTNASGNLVYKGQFDPYGQALTEWSSSGNTNLNTKKFTGYERDATGLDYANARMYNSGRGRFIQADPEGMEASNLRMPQSLNRYAYVQNDPINFIDPSGLNGIFYVCDLLSVSWVVWATMEWGGCQDDFSRAGRSGGGGGGGGGRGRGGAPEPEPCDIQIDALSEDDRAMVATLLGEATPRGKLGQKQYTKDQVGSLNPNSPYAVGPPEGPEVTEATLQAEMLMMVSAMFNRLDSGKFGKTLKDVASSSEMNGYQKGKVVLDDPNFARSNPGGSARCEQVGMALRIIGTVESGTARHPDVLFWKAAIQQGRLSMIVIKYDSDIGRVGFTDFSTKN